MNDYIKKNLMIIISIGILLGIFIYGYKLSSDIIRGIETSIMDVKRSCDQFEKTGVFIHKNNIIDNKALVTEFCNITNRLKSNRYNAYSVYLISIDSEDPIPQIYFFIIPIIIILCSSYSLSYYLKHTNKNDIKNDKHSINLFKNSYKNIILFPIFVVIALMISLIISGHIYYQESIDIGFNLDFIDVLFYIIYVISVFGIFSNVALIVGRRESNFIINTIISTLICGIIIFLVGNYLEIEVPVFIEPMAIDVRTVILVLLTFLTITHIVYGLYKDKDKLIESKEFLTK